ncbi:MAG: PilZ domain-containing protein [Myxococcota bacterium]
MLLEGLGKVVHVNPLEHAVPGMGIEFVNLDEDSRQLIDRLVQDRLYEGKVSWHRFFRVFVTKNNYSVKEIPL